MIGNSVATYHEMLPARKRSHCNVWSMELRVLSTNISTFECNEANTSLFDFSIIHLLGVYFIRDLMAYRATVIHHITRLKRCMDCVARVYRMLNQMPFRRIRTACGACYKSGMDSK